MKKNMGFANAGVEGIRQDGFGSGFRQDGFGEGLVGEVVGGF